MLLHYSLHALTLFAVRLLSKIGRFCNHTSSLGLEYSIRHLLQGKRMYLRQHTAPKPESSSLHITWYAHVLLPQYTTMSITAKNHMIFPRCLHFLISTQELSHK